MTFSEIHRLWKGFWLGENGSHIAPFELLCDMITTQGLAEITFSVNWVALCLRRSIRRRLTLFQPGRSVFPFPWLQTCQVSSLAMKLGSEQLLVLTCWHFKPFLWFFSPHWTKRLRWNLLLAHQPIVCCKCCKIQKWPNPRDLTVAGRLGSLPPLQSYSQQQHSFRKTRKPGDRWSVNWLFSFRIPLTCIVW